MKLPTNSYISYYLCSTSDLLRQQRTVISSGFCCPTATSHPGGRRPRKWLQTHGLCPPSENDQDFASLNTATACGLNCCNTFSYAKKSNMPPKSSSILAGDVNQEQATAFSYVSEQGQGLALCYRADDHQTSSLENVMFWFGSETANPMPQSFFIYHQVSKFCVIKQKVTPNDFSLLTFDICVIHS